MKRLLCTGLLAALVVSTGSASGAELRMLTSWDKNNPAVPAARRRLRP